MWSPAQGTYHSTVLGITTPSTPHCSEVRMEGRKGLQWVGSGVQSGPRGALTMGLQGWQGNENPRAVAQGRGNLPGSNCGGFGVGVVAWEHFAGVHLVLPEGCVIDTQSAQAEAALNNLIEQQRCYQNYLSKFIIPCFLLFGCISKYTSHYQ